MMMNTMLPNRHIPYIEVRLPVHPRRAVTASDVEHKSRDGGRRRCFSRLAVTVLRGWRSIGDVERTAPDVGIRIPSRRR